jgi:NADH-quinone oxidoreductase subunit J
MIFTSILFYLFSICLVISTFIVVVVKHPVFSILFLAISFILVSFLLFLLECEFLALLFLIIYLGAILVLFLFAVMMLDFKTNSLLKNKMKYIPIGLIFNFFLIVPLFINVDLNFINNFNFSHFYQNIYQNWYCLIDSTTDTQIYSQILYSYYVLQFLISGLILMNVLISVVYLTNTFYKQQINHQSVFKQLSRNIKFFYKI